MSKRKEAAAIATAQPPSVDTDTATTPPTTERASGPAPTPQLVELLALGAIVPSPTNPRKSFDEGELEELAASIREKGVLSPILVRPRPDGAHYEVVYGERRWRAAQRAGLAAIPALVRALDDREVLEIQVVENARRSDIHPLEEAEAYRQLREVHRLSVEEIAAKVGKAAKTVAGRLRLCEVPEAFRARLLAGDYTLLTALALAKIPSEKLRDQAAQEILSARWGDAVGMQDTQARRHLAQRYTLLLANAPFDAGDATLVPEAGACTTCAHRSGNQGELLPEVSSPDVCLSPDCFAAKRDAAWERQAAEARARGYEVASKTRCKELYRSEWDNFPADDSGLVDLEQPCREGNFQGSHYGKPWGKLLGKDHGLSLVLARDAKGDPHTLVSKKDALKLLRANGKIAAAETPSSRSSTTTSRGKGAKGSARDPKKPSGPTDEDVRKRARPRIVEQLVAKAAAAKDLGAPLLRVIAAALLDANYHCLGDVAARRGLVAVGSKRDRSDVVLTRWIEKTTDAAALRGLVLELAVCAEAYDPFHALGKKRPGNLGASPLELALAHYKVDGQALEKQARKDLEPAHTPEGKALARKLKAALPKKKAKGAAGLDLVAGDEPACRECGCTEADGCAGGCCWVVRGMVEQDLCCRCAGLGHVH